MELYKQIALILFYIFSPLLILHLCHRFRYINKLGAVVVAYILGLLLGNLNILPEGSAKIQETLSNVVIPLAIPMMLFSTNLKNVFLLARKSFVSLLIGVFSVTVVITLGYFTFRGEGIADLWKVAGLLVGVYTGGTPNLASLKLILDVDDTTYLITHSSDLIVGGFYLFFLITFAQKLFGRFLKPYPAKQIPGDTYRDLDGTDPYMGILRRERAGSLLKVFLLSLLIVAIAVGLAQLVPENSQVAVIMLLITTLALGAAFIPQVNRIEKSFELGMYLVLIFSVVVASMVNIPNLVSGAPTILFYVVMVIAGSLLLQVLLSKIFGIDTDTVIITSTALVCSPPFVPVVADALRNREIVVPGITIGIVGYAIGNYLGFVLAELLKGL